jgi:diguanylate cyclase (GGDEF)-like protein
LALTLRARLTAAFLAVVLGPVLLGAVLVAFTVQRVDSARAAERLNVASNAVRGSIDALCDQLRSVAQSAALLSEAGRDRSGAAALADGGADVRVEDLSGRVLFSTPDVPPAPWAQCFGPTGDDRPGGGTGQTGDQDRYTAIAARVQMLDQSGTPIGYVSAVRGLDTALLGRLAAGAASVTLIGDGLDRLSTDRADKAVRVATVAAGLAGGATGRTPDGGYVRRLAPTAGQPLPLAISTPSTRADGLGLILAGVAALAAMIAVLIAWWLAQGTTRPLAELTEAVDRVANGDLSARAPVRSFDEIGRLAATFNRMTREMQAYVGALTASRDQLRGHLDMLGRTLSSTHDLHRILGVILQTARAVTGARSGAVLLVEQDALVGISDDVPLRVPLGAGLLGTVAATGTPQRGRVGLDRPALAPEEPTCQTYVAVPLRGPDSVRGVLALYDRLGADEFDDTDVATLRTFAGQAAIAVENVRMHEEAQRLSHTDPLTGLYNYRTLKDSLRREVERANRFGHRLCVLVLDLDRFKDVNDSFGHAAGDAVLVEFARRVRAEIREVDLAFRQGGEEFVLLLPETDAGGGVIVAERLCAAIRATPMVVPPRLPASRSHKLGSGVPVTVSVGVAVFPDDGTSGAAVMEAADDALYAAKAAGRNTCRSAVPPSDLVAGPPSDLVAGPPSDPGAGPASDPVAGTSAGLAAGTAAELVAGGGGSGASSGPHAPRQSRGR